VAGGVVTKKLSNHQLDILRWTEMHGEYKVVGVVSVLAARDLTTRGLVEMVKDEADESGIGQATVKHIP
jgi:hypothetical protein